ncbi:uncharacterized protein LOC128718351 [Anopheles marshallii]|uniref:uncharacterized protein LOC128718351 n=1 Tax=Anopheles marshallii TaxID=1521116 RepID=UPI00237C3597|nr:uncharacterized protein LOC128718351 [Anopheles marshallii]
MEQSVGSKLAILVYHYFLERRMVDVAEMFAEKCIYLKDIKRSPYHCLFSSTPLQSLRWFLVEHEALLGNMKRLVQMYHEVAPLPFEASSWDKIQFLMHYFYERATSNSSNATVAESHKKIPEHITSPQTVNITVERDDVNCYQVENHVQQTPSMQQKTQNVSLSKTTHQNICAETDHTNGIPERPMVLYVTNGSKEQLNQNTIVIEMDEREIARNMQTDNVDHIITLEDQDVSISQQIEVHTIMLESDHVPSTSPHCPPIVVADDAHQYANVSANKENQEPLTVPTELMPESEQQNTATEHALCEITSSPRLISMDDSITVVEFPSPPTQEPDIVKRKPIDPEALEEWKRIRSINSRNFDDHIRQMNREYELMCGSPKKVKKSGPTKSKPTPQKQNRCKKALAPKQTIRATKKRKVENEPNKRENELPPAKRPAVLLPLDSDSPDFTSSADEDEDVRGMARRIKQYRQQQKRCQTKAKKSEESTDQQSNEFSSPSTLKQCRVNLIVGRRSARKSPVKSGLHNRTPSTSPAGTPVKFGNLVTDNTAVPAAHLVGTISPQPTQSGKKVKELTDHQKTVTTSVTAKQPAPVPVALSPNNRRPVRACTVNRKTIVASTPLKLTVPNVENVAAAHTTPERRKNSNTKPVTELNLNTEPIPEANNPDTVDAGEAAIYAVLAQLHGDN